MNRGPTYMGYPSSNRERETGSEPDVVTEGELERAFPEARHWIVVRSVL